MTGSVKKRTSKWDLKVETDVPAESRHNNAWPDKAGESIHNKESSSGWNSPKVAGSQDPRWSNMESNKSWEQLPAKRGADPDDGLSRDINEISQSMTECDGDRSYSSSMSPGLDAWRQQNQSHSPKSSLKSLGSRSRSPPHGFKRGSEHWRDRSRSGSGVSAPTCNDFAAGRCRRGSQCRFLHQDNRDYEVRRHFERGQAENLVGRHDDSKDPERGPVERWRVRHDDGGSSESGSEGNCGSKNERGSFSRHFNNEELIDYSRDMISHGYGDREKHEPPRNYRYTNHCNNFLKGKCYRGSSCKYAHHDVLDDGHGGWSAKDVTRDRVHDGREAHECDRGREPFRTNDIPCKYFAAGNCHYGAHCRFSHDGPGRCNPEDRSQGDRWGNNLDNEGKWGGPNWSDTAVAPDIAKDDRWGRNLDNKDNSWGSPKWSDSVTGSVVAKDHSWGHNSDIEPNAWRDPKLSDTAVGSDVAKDDKLGHNLGNKPVSWGGPRWSDKAAGPDVAKSPNSRTDSVDGQVDFNEPWVTKRSKDDQWGHSSDNENRPRGGPTWSDKAAGHGMFGIPHRSEKNGASMSIPESIGGSKPLGIADTSAAAAVTGQYPFYINKIEHRQISQDSQSRTPNGISLPTCEQNTTQEVLHQQQFPKLRGDAAIAFPYRDSNILPLVPMPGQSFNHDGQSGQSSSFNMIWQSEQILPPHPPSGQTLNLGRKTETIISESPSNIQGQTPFPMGGPIIKSEMEDAKSSKVTSVSPLTHNVVTSEQVAQITNISASLAQIFGNGQQLPQLYAALNPPNSIGLVPSQPSPAATGTTVTLPSNDPNQTNWSQKPYDHMVARIESSRPATSDQPSVFSSSHVEQKVAEQHVEQKVAEQMHLKSSVASSLQKIFSEETLKRKSHDSKQLEPVAVCEAVVKNDKTDQKTKEENGHSQDMDVDNRVDEECKRSKDAKAMRMFKFALVEFAKEILKPTWKEGQLSKEAHKTIIKKVVDKVTGTIQGANVPQTQEKIDHYLSYAKPKLTKLVQAYVDKYLKS